MVGVKVPAGPRRGPRGRPFPKIRRYGQMPSSEIRSYGQRRFIRNPEARPEALSKMRRHGQGPLRKTPGIRPEGLFKRVEIRPEAPFRNPELRPEAIYKKSEDAARGPFKNQKIWPEALSRKPEHRPPLRRVSPHNHSHLSRHVLARVRSRSRAPCAASYGVNVGGEGPVLAHACAKQHYRACLSRFPGLAPDAVPPTALPRARACRPQERAR